MKKSHLAILGGGVLLLAFVVGGYVYKRQAAQKVLAATQAPPAAPGGTAAPADAGKAAPPRLSPVLVRDHAMSAGPADARVILVEYFDPGCETCRVFASFVKSLLQSHPTQVRLVLRYAPFHQGADMMVAILEAARLQNRYWETLQVMYDTQPQWASHHHPQPERIWEFLPSAGVDLDQIRRDRHGVIRVGGDFEFLRLYGLQSQHPHSSRNAVLAAHNALIVQYLGNTRCTIALPVEVKYPTYLLIQSLIRLCSPARHAPAPSVVSAP